MPPARLGVERAPDGDPPFKYNTLLTLPQEIGESFSRKCCRTQRSEPADSRKRPFTASDSLSSSRKAQAPRTLRAKLGNAH